MNRKRYKSYLQDPFLDVGGSGIPRQTRYNFKNRATSSKTEDQPLFPTNNNYDREKSPNPDEEVCNLLIENGSLNTSVASSDHSDSDFADSSREDIAEDSEEDFEHTLEDLPEAEETNTSERSLNELLSVADVAKDLSQNIKKRTDRRSNDISYVEEIFDGKLYRSLNLEEFDLTGTVNSDGVPCYDSSKFAVWPFLISLNELSYYLRRKHTIIAALWFGKEKPVFKTFLKPIVQELNEVSKQRLSWISDGIPVSSSVFFPLLAADSVARCSLQGLTQFNGAYGCPTCLEKGETHWESESSHKWIYKSHNAPKRTHTGFLQDIGVLRENLVLGANCSSFHGIKEATPLLLLKTFDIVNGFTFDYMHTVELGASRYFANAWLDSRNHNKPFYIGDRINEINANLVAWRIPHDLSSIAGKTGNPKLMSVIYFANSPGSQTHVFGPLSLHTQGAPLGPSMVKTPKLTITSTRT
ncbi:unnamed protein product [Allacma fusca]|uniref:Transposase domain-containing protein n=1 Tax=Allacma fusca TaxID=39272 RepID=A0A8J2LPR2_9HEXA|nr:unnamed protein product [Allacma fusca]